MINDLDIVQWEYLLSPEFELINSAGKPLTGGWIEVYLHGTRNKYYCASDFNGTLHPFKIPLDSIGANVVLADPNNAYDVYVYNKFGSLIMSRYNVKCQGSGGSSTYVGDKLYYGQYRASNVTTIANLRRNKGNINLSSDGYLKLKSGMSYHITVRGSFTVDDPANEDTTLNYIEYTSVNPIKIDIDETKEGPQYFELSYDIYRIQEDMDYQVAFAQSNGMVTDLIVEVHSLSNLATSATGGDQEYEAGWGIDITNNVVSVDPSIFEDYTYTAGDYISIDDNNVISVTGINPGDFATHGEVYEATVTAIELVTGMIPDAQVQSDWNETDTEDPAYIKNKPDLSIYATHDEVNNVSGKIIETVNNVSGVLHEEIIETAQTVSSLIPDSEEVQFEEINLADYALASAIPDVSDFTTHTEVYEAIVTGVQLATSVIPDPLEAGEYVSIVNNVITVTGLQPEGDYATNSDVYDATVTAINIATGAIPDSEAVQFEEINLADYALASSIPDVSDFTTHTEVYDSTVSAINFVTGMIPEAQVQSDWTEDDDTDPAYIKHKPEEYNLVAGDNITIDVSGTNIVISSEGGIASAASACTVEFVNIYDYRGQITTREPGADLTYTGGTALANAMRDIMLRGHMPLLVYGAPANITEVFTPIWLDTREFAVGTNPGYSCVPLTGHEFFFKNPVTSFITTKIVIDALNDKISNFTVSADTVATVGRGLTVDYFGAGDPWVWYEGHGPTPPVSASTTPGKCLIEVASSIPDVTQVQTMIDASITGIPTTEYTAGDNIEIDNNVISVKDVIMIHARPDSASGLSAFGNITHWGNQDYGPGWYVKAHTDNDKDYVAYNTSDIGQEEFFWGQYATDRETNGVSAVSNLSIHEGDITYKAGEFQSTSTLPIVWSCNQMAQDISNLQGAITEFATESEVYNAVVTGVQAATGLIPDTSDMATQTWVNNQGYLTSVPDNYATDIEVSQAIASSVTGFVTEPQVTALIPDSEEVQFEELDITQFAQVSAIPVVTGFATKAELSDVEATIPTVQLNGDDQVTAINNHEIAGTGGTTYTAGEYISIENDEISVTGLEPLPEIVEMDALEIKAGTNIAIVTGVSDITISVTGIEIPDTSDMATKTWVGNQGYLTSIPDTYATDIEVSEAIASSVTGFLTEPQVTALIPDTEDVTFEEIDIANYALASAIPDVTSYATHAEVYEAVVTGVQVVTGLIPDVSNFVTDTEVTTEITEAVSGKQDLLTGITDVQVVTGLPVAPTQDVLYLIVEA